MRNHGKQNERSHRLDNQSTAVKAPVEQPSANENTNVQVQPRHINRNEAHAPLQKNTLLLTDFFCYSKNTSIRDFQNSIADLAVSITENTKSKEDGGNEDTVFETKKDAPTSEKLTWKDIASFSVSTSAFVVTRRFFAFVFMPVRKRIREIPLWFWGVFCWFWVCRYRCVFAVGFFKWWPKCVVGTFYIGVAKMPEHLAQATYNCEIWVFVLAIAMETVRRWSVWTCLCQ